jgi:fimbrial chaperone protein
LRPTRPALLAALLLGLAAPALGGTLRVSPLKVFFDRSTASATVQVRNAGAEKTSIQADVRAWSVTADGRDAYEDTSDFVFFPRIFEVEPGEDGVVRLAYRGETALPTEQSYRIFLRELPTPGKQEEGVGFLIELSVPIFIRASHPRSEGTVAGAELAGSRIQVRVENRGTEFFVVDSIVAAGRDDAGQETFRSQVGGWYVLAGTTRPFSVAVEPEACRRTRTVTVEAVWSGAARSLEFDVDPERCDADPLLQLRGPPGEQ